MVESEYVLFPRKPYPRPYTCVPREEQIFNHFLHILWCCPRYESVINLSIPSRFLTDLQVQEHKSRISKPLQWSVTVEWE